jgi:hypothetical protein
MNTTDIKTETVTFNWEALDLYEYRYLNTLIGCRVVYTATDGKKLIGVIEDAEGSKFTNRKPVRIRFADGGWANLADTFEMVMAS